METNEERRTRRLKQLCIQKGGVKAVAKDAHLGWEGLDQVLKGTLLPPRKGDKLRTPRSLGADAARAIEDAYELGRGWFDWPFDAVEYKDYWSLTPMAQGVVQGEMRRAIKDQIAAGAVMPPQPEPPTTQPAFHVDQPAKAKRGHYKDTAAIKTAKQARK